MDIEKIARLITEDPDVHLEGRPRSYGPPVQTTTGYIHEVPVPSSLKSDVKPKVKGDAPSTGTYAGLEDESTSTKDLCYVTYEIDFVVWPEERRTYDYPGAPEHVETQNVKPKSVEGAAGPYETITPELEDYLVDYFWEHEDDFVED